ncbi:MAG: L,D-transpeptidase family protein [Candidatus Omnitrophica bacterium]|nr:L,D-transpeptidase family protein [Candidatus Omnitrophota bacterium]
MRSPHLKKQIIFTRPAAQIGILLILILLLSTVALFYLYVKDKRQRHLLVYQIQETRKALDQIQLAMARGDMKKAFTELTQAQKEVDDLLPRVTAPSAKPEIARKQQGVPAAAAVPGSKPAEALPVSVQPPPETTGVKPSPAIIPAGLTLAADEVPYPLVLAEAGEYLLVTEKDQRTLHLFRYLEGRFTLLKSYPCIVGANNLDKKKEGDLATPVGNYFSLRYIPGQKLPEKYGHGAFVLNYPNFMDRKVRKEGTGIWLHGHTPAKNLGDQELQNTRGCIVVDNDVLKELSERLKASGTPMIIVSRLKLIKRITQQQRAEELTAFMKSWSKAWESGNINKFMSHYASDFINSEGMGYQSLKRQKEKVNRGKKFIHVAVENPAMLLSQEDGGQIAVVRFTQRYRSSNFTSDSRKLFYLKRGEARWRVIGESRL